MSDEPIEEGDYKFGVNVVNMGQARVARGKTVREKSNCPHTQLLYDIDERRIWCSSCRSTIDNFDAFCTIVINMDREQKKLKQKTSHVIKLITSNLTRIVSKTLDRIWASNTEVPVCPHCKEGLLASDFDAGNILTASKVFVEAKRKKKIEKR